MFDLAEQWGVLEIDAVGDAVLGNAPVPLAESDAELDACEVRSEAAVDPAAEAEVAVDVTVEVDNVGSLVWTRSSVFAEPSRHTIWLPAFRGQPLSSRSSVTIRGTKGTGDSKRRSSSMAAGMIAGSSTTRRRCSRGARRARRRNR